MVRFIEQAETGVEIVVVDTGRKGHTALDVQIVGELCGFSLDNPLRFVRWSDSQGGSPLVGQAGSAVMNPTSRQKRFVTDGTFDTNQIDGSEAPWQVEWSMISFKPGGTAATAQTTDQEFDPGHSFKLVTGAMGAVNSGPVAFDYAAKFRAEAMAVNDREALRVVVEMSKSSADQDIYALLDNQSLIADHLNKRFLDRFEGQVIDSPMVKAAVEKGAVVVDVRDDETPKDAGSQIKNEKDMRAYVSERQKDDPVGWSAENLKQTLNGQGYEDSATYLSKDGNTAASLVDLFKAAVDW